MNADVPDPVALLREDRARAAERADRMANLCVVATVDAAEPEARTMVLRDLEPALSGPPSLGLFVNSTSPKFGEFRQSSTVAIVVYLPSLAVQYRLRCSLEQLPEGLVRASWQLRPPIPKRMDWLYEDHPQSSVIDGREALVDLLHGPEPTVAPESAIGFKLVAESVERLDLNTEDGIHDRRRYAFDGQSWHEEVLVP
ncbi:MAG: hypothetical protein OXI79_01665 [Gammaproteobacteria bacterium]|nr:hypothetical protein [Gammaproteobacteria bacterium]